MYGVQTFSGDFNRTPQKLAAFLNANPGIIIVSINYADGIGAFNPCRIILTYKVQ